MSRCTISVALGAVVKRRVRTRINRLTEQRIRGDVERTIEIQPKPLRKFVLRNFPTTEDGNTCRARVEHRGRNHRSGNPCFRLTSSFRAKLTRSRFRENLPTARVPVQNGKVNDASRIKSLRMFNPHEFNDLTVCKGKLLTMLFISGCRITNMADTGTNHVVKGKRIYVFIRLDLRKQNVVYLPCVQE